MDRLINLLAAVWDWISWAFRASVDGLVAFVQTVYGKILIVLGWAGTIILFGKGILDRLLELITSTLFETFSLAIPSTVIDAMALANFCFPIVDTILFTIAYVNVLLIMVFYRHAKSMIPSPVPGGGGT